MFYRRKLLLATLQLYDGKLSATSLQKILFLISRKQVKRSYDFVPYKYGCFSFQANQDLHTLIKYGLTDKQKNNNAEYWILKNGDDYLKELSGGDKLALKNIREETKGMNQRELIRLTYLAYPFYAINSQIADEVLSATEKEKINGNRPRKKEREFFTIGYEGLSLENYINKLILHDVRLLCDVRKNPVSMKYGFSKSQLKNACESVGIQYRHIPELGIESDKRKNLKEMRDYRSLFKLYETTTLKEHAGHLEILRYLAVKYRRVAITCFEHKVTMCHRGNIAGAMTRFHNWNIPVTHL